MTWPSDAEILADIVALTAEFRYRICWVGARRLLVDRGIDPMRCLQLSCDQGDDVNTTLVLPDGVIVSVDFKEDSEARSLVSIAHWQAVGWNDRETTIAREVVLGADQSSFDSKVSEYFEEHWQGRDSPLQPKA